MLRLGHWMAKLVVDGGLNRVDEGPSAALTPTPDTIKPSSHLAEPAVSVIAQAAREFLTLMLVISS